MAGVLNLLKKGRRLNIHPKNGVLCPAANKIEKIIINKNAHLMGERIMSMENTNTTNSAAPKYTGPEVKGWLPQYDMLATYRLICSTG
jgi:hypothetical protein